MKALILGSGFLCAATLLVSATTPAAAANLVKNGSFEQTDVEIPSHSWLYFGDVNTNGLKQWEKNAYAGQGYGVAGWTPLVGSTIEIRDNHVGQAYEGTQFAELDSHAYNKNASEIGFFQDIVTQIGQKYKLTFAYGPRQENAANGDNKLAVSFGDLYEELNAGNNGDGWQLFSQTMTATSELTTLKFLSLGMRNTLGANVDAVSVEAVPEPFTVLGLAAVGAIGATSAIRKRFSA